MIDIETTIRGVFYASSTGLRELKKYIEYRWVKHKYRNDSTAIIENKTFDNMKRSDIVEYWMGQYRSFVLRENKNALSAHTIEQYDMRLESMKKECKNGSCIVCGCATPELQMSNKPCEGKCYPKMLSKKEWEQLKKEKEILIDGATWTIKNKKFKPHGRSKKTMG